MCVCMCACVYVCMYVSMYACMYICTYILCHTCYLLPLALVYSLHCLCFLILLPSFASHSAGWGVFRLRRSPSVAPSAYQFRGDSVERAPSLVPPNTTTQSIPVPLTVPVTDRGSGEDPSAPLSAHSLCHGWCKVKVDGLSFPVFLGCPLLFCGTAHLLCQSKTSNCSLLRVLHAGGLDVVR